MPKSSGVSCSTSHSTEMEPNSGIRAATPLSHIPEGPQGTSPVIAALSSDMESVQTIIHLHAGQLIDVMGQLRSVSDELRKIQLDRHNDRMERLNDKEELKSLVITLSNQTISDTTTLFIGISFP